MQYSSTAAYRRYNCMPTTIYTIIWDPVHGAARLDPRPAFGRRPPPMSPESHAQPCPAWRHTTQVTYSDRHRPAKHVYNTQGVGSPRKTPHFGTPRARTRFTGFTGSNFRCFSNMATLGMHSVLQSAPNVLLSSPTTSPGIISLVTTHKPVVWACRARYMVHGYSPANQCWDCWPSTRS
jgi:hypothetical protein